MALRVAQRKSAKMKINFSGLSGSGKTMSALKFARGLVDDWGEIAVLDTENSSSELYANLGGFLVQPFKPPYSPQRFCKAIDYFKDNGVKCMLIDSASSEWSGSGGIIEIHETLGGGFRQWAQATPMHQKFVDHIVHADMHMLTTVRTKADYSVDKDQQGRNRIRKIAMKPDQKDNWSYNFSISFDIDQNHMATIDKNRTDLFLDDVPFFIDEGTGRLVREWNESC